MKYKIKVSECILAILFGFVPMSSVKSQTVVNEYQTRVEAKVSFEPIKKIEISFNPELRFDESFSIDKYMLESKLTYKPIKGLSVGGGYRFIANNRETKSTEYLHRFALDAKYKMSFNRLTPSLRLKYTNYTEEASKGQFLRYKASVSYNIKKCKFSPEAGFEPFHELSSNEFYKIRYSLGVDYKINKESSINLGYALDYYLQDFLNKHIVYLGYKYKF
jgi:hypothetical protein